MQRRAPRAQSCRIGRTLLLLPCALLRIAGRVQGNLLVVSRLFSPFALNGSTPMFLAWYRSLAKLVLTSVKAKKGPRRRFRASFGYPLLAERLEDRCLPS